MHTDINPRMLIWARETAGLTLASAAKILEIGDTKQKTAEQRLSEYEAGDTPVSYDLLVRMSTAYRRSQLFFYLEEPPRRADRGKDFRTRAGAKPLDSNPPLDAFVRDIILRQRILKEAAIESERDENRLVKSAANVNAQELADLMRKGINFSRAEYRRQSGYEEAFSYLRNLIEGSGIFVLLAGHMGSSRLDISPEDFSGYAIADSYAPLVVVNDNDSKAAWSFTLLHELAHIFLGQTGMSDLESTSGIEKLCNTAAAYLLVSDDELRRLAKTPMARLGDQISIEATNWNVSRTMIAYNLHSRAGLSSFTYNQLHRTFELQREALQSANKDDSEGRTRGPDYYVTRRYKLGRELVGNVRSLLGEEFLTTSQAATILGVAPRGVSKLLEGR